ncbi:hypothetical protein ACK3TF_005007 [Chlorella vulgaris]
MFAGSWLGGRWRVLDCATAAGRCRQLWAPLKAIPAHAAFTLTAWHIRLYESGTGSVTDSQHAMAALIERVFATGRARHSERDTCASAAFADCGAKPADVPPPSPSRRPKQAQWPVLPPWQRLRQALVPDPLEHVRGLGTLAPTARPSTLQPLHCHGGAHSPSALCRPRLAPCGTRPADLLVAPSGELQPTDAAQCHLSLGRVKGVPRSGAAHRTPLCYTARACLYDGARFHGNAITPRAVKPGRQGDTWMFDAQPLLVRCPKQRLPTMQARQGYGSMALGVAEASSCSLQDACVAAATKLCAHMQCGAGNNTATCPTAGRFTPARPLYLQLYLELCVSHQLLPEEEAAQRLLPCAAACQLGDVCVAWTLVSLATLPSLHSPRSLRAPLCGGPLSQRRSLQAYAAAAAAAAAASGAPPARQVVAGASMPVRLSPVPSAHPTAHLLPAAAVASKEVALAAGLYRQQLALQGGGALAQVADAVLAALPAILDDAELSEAFLELWAQQQAAAAAATHAASQPAGVAARQLEASFQLCATAVWAAAASQAIPPPGLGGRRAERRAKLHRLLHQHAVVGLNSTAHAWLHKPFEAAELCRGPLQQLGATV